MDKNLPSYKPEVWGGIECTINRVGDRYRDQLTYSGHYSRSDDIARIASLNIKALRYPVLWELHQTSQQAPIDWTWTEQQLENIRQNKIIPIAGLVHHGSGPSFTNLMDDNFSSGLGEYAGAVAAKFPWLEYFTPVNEPLTTARFSGLYGLWYPHESNALSFMTMLLNQVKGVVLAMKAIRKINPQAKLIQTEDLAKVHSTPLLNYQADFENERRWLSFDLLCGRVNDHHPLWDYLTAIGVPIAKLQFFQENPCPPDLIGLNYYVTSERFLDENLDSYPGLLAGGNGKHVYVDTEAVRVSRAGGLGVLLKETWDRYQIPIAITEAHLGCTREEQLRWIKEIWDTCCDANEKGIHVRAVTAWSLLGAYDWDSLLTVENNHYESGVFDIRNGVLRPTAIAKLISTLATQGSCTHPLLESKGWWCRDSAPAIVVDSKTKPVLIIGKNGTLGNAFLKICDQRGILINAVGRNDLDITNPSAIEAAVDQFRPWAIINASGYVDVDQAEVDQEQCRLINTIGPGLLAQTCERKGLQFMTFSSDLVFNGKKTSPYVEKDKVKPLNQYGRSKAEAEASVKRYNPSALIIRSSAFFGPWDEYNFAFSVLNSLRQGKECLVVNDVIVSPTYVPHLVHAALDLLIDEEIGIWHISNEGFASWAEFARLIAEVGGCHPGKIKTSSLANMNWKAPRPLYSALESSKGLKLPVIESAVQTFFKENILL